MPSAMRVHPAWWLLIFILILILIYILLPGTHPPPFARIGDATSEQLAAACNDPKLHFVGLQAKEADYDTTVRVRITPEFFSFKNKPKDLEVGRVVARVQVLRGSGELPYGLKDTVSACLFISGIHPEGLTTTVISKQGERLYAPRKTWVVDKRHWLAEAHWQEDSVSEGAVRLGLDPRPTALLAESPTTGRASTAATRLAQLVFKTYSQSSCTNHSCCVSSGRR